MLIGFPKSQPCANSTCRFFRNLACASVSTPSATMRKAQRSGNLDDVQHHFARNAICSDGVHERFIDLQGPRLRR